VSKKNKLLYLLLSLLIFNFCLWYFCISEDRKGILTVTFLDVGQGDAIFVDAPNGNQVLIDAGKPHSILGELREVMPLYDRNIDMIIITNPDADHLGGFVDVVRKFKVRNALHPGTKSNSAVSKELFQSIDEAEIIKHVAKRGDVIVLDDVNGVYVLILFPDRDVSLFSPNDGSIQMKLVYGDVSYMLTGDSPIKIEDYLISLGDDLDSTILKAGHHGSKTSSGENFLKKVSPALTVISAGKDNSYGHPHKEVIGTLDRLMIPYLVTADVGRITTYTDGVNMWVK
jgi:competence protein ComEC